MKIEPETALECVAAVRADHPDLTLMLDANQSFDESYLNVLYKLDALNLSLIHI